MSKSLDAFKIMIKDNDLELPYHNTILTIEKELKALEILKAFGFEIEDYTEELNGSVSVKFRRIILDDEEIDLLKEVSL